MTGLSETDLAKVLAVTVPAAIASDPDGLGKVAPDWSYVIADSLGEVRGDAVRFDGASLPLTSGVRAAVEAALSPATAIFVAPDLTRWMLFIAQPTVDGDSVMVTYEQRCGGEPNALCGSGGAFRLERSGDGWRITKVLSGWIS